VYCYLAWAHLTVAPPTATAHSAPDKKSGIASAINNGLASAGPLIVIALLGLGGSAPYVHGVDMSSSPCLPAWFLSSLQSRSLMPSQTG
jgi:hypothetical protein